MQPAKTSCFDLLERQKRGHNAPTIPCQYWMPWKVASLNLAWYEGKEKLSFLDWQLDRWHYLANQLSESRVWLTPGPNIFIKLTFQQAKKHEYCVNTLCRRRRKLAILKSKQIIHLCSLHLIRSITVFNVIMFFL